MLSRAAIGETVIFVSHTRCAFITRPSRPARLVRPASAALPKHRPENITSCVTCDDSCRGILDKHLIVPKVNCVLPLNSASGPLAPRARSRCRCAGAARVRPLLQVFSHSDACGGGPGAGAAVWRHQGQWQLVYVSGSKWLQFDHLASGELSRVQQCARPPARPVGLPQAVCELKHAPCLRATGPPHTLRSSLPAFAVQASRFDFFRPDYTGWPGVSCLAVESSGQDSDPRLRFNCSFVELSPRCLRVRAAGRSVQRRRERNEVATWAPANMLECITRTPPPDPAPPGSLTKQSIFATTSARWLGPVLQQRASAARPQHAGTPCFSTQGRPGT